MNILPEGSVVVRIAANSGSFVYDGTTRDLSGYTVTSSDSRYGTADFSFSGSSELIGRNAGTYQTAMRAGDFQNTNPNYTNVVFEVTNGEMTILPRKVTLTSASQTKDFDGTVLKNNKVTIDGDDGFIEGEGVTTYVTGNITKVGSVDNAFTYAADDGTLLENYDITTAFGKLTIRDITAAETTDGTESTGTTRVYKLYITYKTESGVQVGKVFEKEYTPGAKYEVVTPTMTGFTPDSATVTGTMPSEDKYVTVTYSRIRNRLTINFQAIGVEGDLMDPIVLQLSAGEDYRVTVPTIRGYNTLTKVVSGVMPEGDRQITVLMVKEGLGIF